MLAPFGETDRGGFPTTAVTSIISHKRPPERIVVHKEKMEMEKPQIYRQQGAVAEFPKALIKKKIGLRQFRLPGLINVGIEVL